MWEYFEKDSQPRLVLIWQFPDQRWTWIVDALWKRLVTFCLVLFFCRDVRVLYMQGCWTSSQWPTEEFLRLQEFTCPSRVSVHMDPEGKKDFFTTQGTLDIFQNFQSGCFFLISYLSEYDAGGGGEERNRAGFLTENKCVCRVSIPYWDKTLLFASR